MFVWQSTIKFNVNLKGCQIGWSAYLHMNGTVTSDLNCSFDLDTIPYEFVVTKNHKTSHVEGTFNFAGMHSPRLVMLASMYIPPKTDFAIMLKHAVRIFFSSNDENIQESNHFGYSNSRWIRTWNSVNQWETYSRPSLNKVKPTWTKHFKWLISQNICKL